jgi:cation/acetate symporter
MVDVLGQPAAVFPLKNPGLVTIPLSFGVAFAVAWLWPEPEAEAAYDEVARRLHLGELV